MIAEPRRELVRPSLDDVLRFAPPLGSGLGFNRPIKFDAGTTPPPSIALIDPPIGPTGAGTALTIVGSGFTGATSVTVGGSSCTSLVVVDDSTITCNAPALSAGAKDVVVTTPGGNDTLASGFRVIAGCEWWLRADRGIHTATGVSQWDDQSCTGDSNKDVAQATGSRQPTLTSIDGAYNNHPTLAFSAASTQFLAGATWSVAPATTGTFFVVGNFDNGSTYEGMVSFISNGNAALYQTTSSDLRYYQGVDLIITGASRSGKHIYAVDRNGATTNAYQDALTRLVQGNSGSNALATGIVGALTSGGGSPLQGKVAEVISFNTILGGTDFAAVMNYLGARYAITVGP